MFKNFLSKEPQPASPQTLTKSLSRGSLQPPSSPEADKRMSLPVDDKHDFGPSFEPEKNTSPQKKGPITQVSYILNIFTGNVDQASTSANVCIVIFGDKGNTGMIKLPAADPKGKKYFQRGQHDNILIHGPDVGVINKIRIGHDQKGFSSDWFLDYVTVTHIISGQEVKFPCFKWLDKSKDDGQFIRDLVPEAPTTDTNQEMIKYKLYIKTGEVNGAGTDANVHVQIYGSKGKTTQIKLNNNGNNFERGKGETFTIEALDLGEVDKIRIGHDGSGVASGWFLDSMTLESPTGKKWNFPCGRWFDKKEDDGQIERELAAVSGTPETSVVSKQRSNLTYKVTVVTGDVKSAGTSAKVSITIYGKNGDSGRRTLGGKFDRGAVSTSDIECVDLGDITKIRIEHDNSGMSPGWFLDKVVINDLLTNKDYFFLCGKWFSKDEEDGLLSREISATDIDGNAYLPLTTYKVTVVTGNRKGSGTSANVYIVMVGEKGDSGIRKLEKSRCFETGSTDHFIVEAIELGNLQRIRIGHDNAGFNADWFLEKVVIHSASLNKEWYFLCGKWISKTRDDARLERELVAVDQDGSGSLPFTKYKVEVYTGDRKGAGTDARVSMVVYGSNGDSGIIKLEAPHDTFERGKMDTFGFECHDLGDLNKILIGHDNSGFGPSWFLEKVVITQLDTGRKTYFLCGRWFDKDEDDGQIEREIPASSEDGRASLPLVKYVIKVTTGKIKGAGTDANVFVVLFGSNGDSGKRYLQAKGQPFERGQTDVFGIECVDLGTITRLKIGHDNSGFGADWFLEEVTVQQESTSYKFVCNQWFSATVGDKLLERVLTVGGPSGTPIRLYKVGIITGTQKGTSPDIDAYISIFGTNGNVIKERLANHPQNFERGRLDLFGITCADIGDVQSISIGHTGRGFGAAWFVDKVYVVETDTDKRWVFPCNRWLAKNVDDGKLERTLSPSIDQDTTYCVKVKTGQAGLRNNVQVFIVLHGDRGVTSKLQLNDSLTHFQPFCTGSLDVFNVQHKYIGKITSVSISSSGISGWLVTAVEICDLGTEDVSFFACDRVIDGEQTLHPTEQTLQLVDEYTEPKESDTSASTKEHVEVLSQAQTPQDTIEEQQYIAESEPVHVPVEHQQITDEDTF